MKNEVRCVCRECGAVFVVRADSHDNRAYGPCCAEPGEPNENRDDEWERDSEADHGYADEYMNRGGA